MAPWWTRLCLWTRLHGTSLTKRRGFFYLYGNARTGGRVLMQAIKQKKEAVGNALGDAFWDAFGGVVLDA